MMGSNLAYRNAAARAKEVLKKGDRVGMIAHGSDRIVTYTFAGWDRTSPGEDFFVSQTGLEELHPFNIVRLNGRAVSFRNPED